ncbi:MAG: branched-chain amino acid ABC transporter permease [Halobacteriota archaeon]
MVAALALYPLVYEVLETFVVDQVPVIGSVIGAFVPSLTFMIVVIYIGLFTMSFDFISGYTGYLSFGHAAFFGTGAYFVLLVSRDKIPLLPADTPFMLTLVLGATVAAALALAIGAVSFRLTGVYFAMITLGFAQVIYEAIRYLDWVGSNPTDGISAGIDEAFRIGVPYVDQLSLGISRLRGTSFGEIPGLGIEFGGTLVSYYALGLVALVCYFAMQRIIHSPFGRVMIAIRENEERARAVGYNVFWYKMGAFAMSAFFGGVAGALFAGYRRTVSPENTYYFLVTADALITAIIGGLGTLAGALYGNLFHQTLEDILTTRNDGIATLLRELVPEGIYEAEVVGLSLDLVVSSAVDGRAPLYLGIVFVLFVLYVPNGLLGTVRDRIGGTAAEHLPGAIARYRR